MELTFIANAIRRYLWVVVGLTVAGVVAGVLLSGDDELLYESRAVLLVQPPVDDRGVTIDPDRYVAGQISVLSSQGMAERVVARLDDGTARSSLASAVRVDHELDTNIVHVVVSTPDPERSQVIGNAYVAEYFDSIRQQVDNTQQPDLEKLNEQVETLRERLEANDAARASAMAEYLGRETPPDPEAVIPDLMTEDRLLNYQMQTALEALSALETNARLRVSSEVVQEATLPSDPVASGPNLLLGAGLLGGFGAGLFAAVLFARISPLVIGDDQAEEILGHPIVGQVPVYPRARHDRAALLDELPRSFAGFISGLTVRPLPAPRDRQSLAVVVISPRRGAGSTTLATMVARRFADGGSRVLLVDADRQDPELRSLFMTGRSELPTAMPLQTDAEQPVGSEAQVLAFQHAGAENLFVTDLQTLAGASRLRSPQIRELVDRASAAADVVVFDAGPLLSSVSTMHLTRSCRVVMLAVPVHQDARELEVVASEVRDRSVLPVWTPTQPGQGFVARLPLVGPWLSKRRG